MRLFLRTGIVGGLTLGLLVLAAVGSRQRGWRGDGGTPREVPATIIDSAYTLVVVALCIAALALILRLRRVRRWRAPRRGTSWQAVVFLITFTLVGAYLLSTTEVGHRLSELLGSATGTGPPRGANPAGEPASQGARDPQFQWWLGGLVVAAAVGGYIWYRRSRRPRPSEHRELAEELEVVLTETLDDLESEPDPRRAVIRAYARMETVLAAHGLPRNASEAPLEYLARILHELRVRASSAHALTELFERAKFSQHEIDIAMKDEAIAALATVRDDLKAA
jgi:4-amino-4-deoxy-L-arabinose transferase-like glycosyltransferase